jgi:single-stranded DNA-binding protein
MNSFILMAKIIRTPELRYTQDNQTPFAQMLVEFAGTRPEDPPATIKAIGWGGLATEIAETYTEGDQVILEGRLAMNNFDRPEGFKEKRAEVVISHIYRVEGYLSSSTPPSSSSRGDNVVAMNDFKSKPVASASSSEPVAPYPHPVEPSASPISSESVEENLDDIPF